MNQEKIGALIKDLRKKNHFTQAQFAKRYGVTYQAVSKWETGKNIPDIALLKQISNDFGVNIEELLEGKMTESKNKRNYLLVIGIFFFILVIILLFYFRSTPSFEFKKLSSSCNSFTISGVIAYNDLKSSIHISSIEYCGGDDTVEYKTMECVLYEVSGDVETRLGTTRYKGETPISLEHFLRQVEFNIDHYDRICKQYSNDNLYLQINATDESDKVTTYKIPLKLSDSCSNS